MSQWNLETIKRSHRRTGSGNVAKLNAALHTERAESHKQLHVGRSLTTGEGAAVQCLVSAGGVHGVQPCIRFMGDPSKGPLPVGVDFSLKAINVLRPVIRSPTVA